MYILTNRGVSVIALIAIVAVVAVGGAAAYNYNQTTKTTMSDTAADTETQVADLKAAVEAELPALQRNLSAGATVDIAGALTTIARMKTLLNNARVSASAELEAELDAISAPLDQLEAEITAGSAAAQATLQDIAAVVEADMEVMTEETTNDSMESDASTDEAMGGTSTDEMGTDAGDDSMTDAEVEMGADTMLEMDDVTVDNDVEAEALVN